jgi:hypothetical protein
VKAPLWSLLIILTGIIFVYLFGVGGGYYGHQSDMAKEIDYLLPFKCLGQNYPYDILYLSFGIALIFCGITSIFLYTRYHQITLFFFITVVVSAVLFSLIVVGANTEGQEVTVGKISLLLFLSLALGGGLFAMSYTIEYPRKRIPWAGVIIYGAIVILTIGGAILGL